MSVAQCDTGKKMLCLRNLFENKMLIWQFYLMTLLVTDVTLDSVLLARILKQKLEKKNTLVVTWL